MTRGRARITVQLDQVSKSFDSGPGRLQVLAGVDLAVHEGELVALVGPSGSGKTTLLTILAGWDSPDEGSVSLSGDSHPGQQLPWTDLSIVPQSLALLEELTLAENIELPLRLGRTRDALEIDALMSTLGLTHLAERLPREVSLGEQQRAAVARAAALRPRVLLADEPISHQNHDWAIETMKTIRRLADAGTACVIATHNPAAVDAADRVVELHAGHLRPSPRSADANR